MSTFNLRSLLDRASVTTPPSQFGAPSEPPRTLPEQPYASMPPPARPEANENDPPRAEPPPLPALSDAALQLGRRFDRIRAIQGELGEIDRARDATLGLLEQAERDFLEIVQEVGAEVRQQTIDKLRAEKDICG